MHLTCNPNRQNLFVIILLISKKISLFRLLKNLASKLLNDFFEQILIYGITIPKT